MLKIGAGVFILVVTGAGCMGASIGAKPTASLVGSPSKGPVGKTIQKNSAKFERCARDSVTIQTGTAQNLQLQFEVHPDGSVKKPDILSMSAPDPDLYDCVTQALRNIQFPPPPDGQTKKLQYPMILKQ